jgi:membrane associated rhomboid family serine protease
MDFEVKRFFISLVFPGLLLFLIWVVFILDQSLDLNLYFHGLYPRKISGLQGILFSPLIHSDFKHIMANSIPLLVLGTGLFYFYRDLAIKVFLLSYFMTGVYVWIAARDSYHIGASGLIYSLVGFMFLSGILRKHLGLMAISLIIVFQYGSMIWGIFPLEERVSWESHLLGLIAGFTWAFVFRKEGPQKGQSPWSTAKTYENGEEDEDDEDDDNGLPWYEYEVEGKRKKKDFNITHSLPPEWESDSTD